MTKKKENNLVVDQIIGISFERFVENDTVLNKDKELAVRGVVFTKRPICW
ncbi:hypothetical protein RU98_GL001419 [Enterococcus caccae]|nr:hypothetical protein RU98_GL001419 [Enterococcus caccae]